MHCTAYVLFYLGILMEDVFVAALMREEMCDVHYGHDVRRALLY